MTSDQRYQIIAQLNGRTRVKAFEAAVTIWNDSDQRLEPSLLRTLKKGPRPFNRAAAAYAMQMVSSQKTILALELAVRNKSEHARVRGEAAEALAHRHRKQSHEVLLAGLRDPSTDVRFWCTFALGVMGELRAVPLLRDLAANDKRVVKGFYSVSKEAADAIENIQEGHSGHRRKHGCVFCVRE